MYAQEFGKLHTNYQQMGKGAFCFIKFFIFLYSLKFSQQTGINFVTNSIKDV